MAYEDDHFIDTGRLVWNYSFFSDAEIKKFGNGELYTAYEKFGAHKLHLLNTDGYYFAVWAPHASMVSVIGEFNGWKKQLHPLFPRLDKSGIWEGFIPRIAEGIIYKYHIQGSNGLEYDKADPYGKYCELRPSTGSITWNLHYDWKDQTWMHTRKKENSLSAPWSVYEVHLGSWMRPDKHNKEVFNSYLELADRLVPYVKAMGFTHVEFMPVMEHPYDGSWGYQGTGFFAPTSRYGHPQEFMQLIDKFHEHGIGVLLDWVPSHFPHDAHGLHVFDGAYTYEYEDMRKGYHPDWNSYIFNYKRGEVKSFLLSSAHFWLKTYHADGIRVDAVNSIIRLDFSRKEGEWERNELGSNENLEAIEFIKSFNEMVCKEFPDVQTIAEEASDWPAITHPIQKKGFGFGMKWMMGWMHDSFRYFKKDPALRSEYQDDLSFSMMYFYDEKFMLPISHDEVVHGKSPMIYKMPGNEWEQFANLRLLYAYMFTHPGAKLLFMGCEFAQTSEWNFETELQWELLQYASHNGVQECVRSLNHMYKEMPALHELQFDKKGFEWISLDNPDKGIIVYKRKARHIKDDILIVLNISRHPQLSWKVPVKTKNHWEEIFNSDDEKYWGSGKYYNPSVKCEAIDKKRRHYEIIIDIPALGALIFK